MSTIIDKIRLIDVGLQRLKFKSVTVSRENRSVDVELICDKAVSFENENRVREQITAVLPDGFVLGEFKITKILADGELVAKSVYEYLERQHKSVAHSMSVENISAEVRDGLCAYTVSADDDVCRYLTDNSVLSEVSEYLSSVYCSDFTGNLKSVGKAIINEEILKVKTSSSEYETLAVRSFKVGDPVKLWGDDIDPTALYMADSGLVSGDVTFAGTVTAINQKTTKNGKPFYVFEFTDTTDKLQGKVFLTKEKEKKIEKINVGTQILTKGDIAVFNGNNSYVIRDLSFCEFPSDFVPEERAGKSVPDEYLLVKPSTIEDVSQGNLFAVEKDVEECLIGKKFVVVDIETTGLNYASGDKITEIGAVRIIDGKIVDKFQTLINPEQKISEEITRLTGIDDGMVADKPVFDKVLPDFYKYCDGCTIVAHNIDFDYKFIKYMSSKTGYVFKNKGIDTLAFSKEVLPRLKNHKLNTVCDYFGIEFLHHRALSDAHATAKLFVKLAEVKKSLPDGV